MASTDLADTIEQARNSIAASLDSMRSERVRSDFSSSFLARGAAESAASADDWMRLGPAPPDLPQSAAHYLWRADAAGGAEVDSQVL